MYVIKLLPPLRSRLGSYLLLSFCLISMQASSVVMRHDVDPQEYLLDAIDYQSTFHIDGCTAALIESRWVLTAAHCTGSRYHKGHLVTIGDEQIPVESVHNHPEFSEEQNDYHDIALIRLQEPVFGTIPTPLYEGDDELEQLVKLTGFGNTGNGNTGVNEHCFPCQLRGADNRIVEANDFYLRIQFDDPSSIDSLPLEGVSGSGDSGAPLYIETSSGRFVAGVSSFGGNRYGDSDHFTRVSKELGWLTEVMGDDYSGNYAGLTYSEQQKLEDANNENTGGGSQGYMILLLLTTMSMIRAFNRRALATTERQVSI